MAVILPTLVQTSWRQGVELMLLTSVEVRFDRRATKDVALSRIELVSLRDKPFIKLVENRPEQRMRQVLWKGLGQQVAKHQRLQ
jgi:hypothetical protein